MPSSFQAPPAYPRLHRHPLASAMIAVFSAAAMVLVVTCFCNQEAASKSAAAQSEAPGGNLIPQDLP